VPSTFGSIVLCLARDREVRQGIRVSHRQAIVTVGIEESERESDFWKFFASGMEWRADSDNF
jgi:hypothetical protein